MELVYSQIRKLFLKLRTSAASGRHMHMGRSADPFLATELGHFVGKRRQVVPKAPEFVHIFLSTDGHTDVPIHFRDDRPEYDVVLFEILDSLSGGQADLHEHEVRERINLPQHARIGLVVKLLALIRISP